MHNPSLSTLVAWAPKGERIQSSRLELATVGWNYHDLPSLPSPPSLPSLPPTPLLPSPPSLPSLPQSLPPFCCQTLDFSNDVDSSLLQDEQDLSDFSRSYDSETQTPPLASREQPSQVDNPYISTNGELLIITCCVCDHMTYHVTIATLGSALSPDILSPESSSSSWRTPLSPVHMSPVRHAPLSPAIDTPPPLYAPPSPPPQVPQRPPSPTEVAMSSYVPPFLKVVSAAKRGDQQQVSSHASDLSARVIRLVGLADSAASALDRDADLVK